MAQPNQPGKEMSSRLLTMKFMQRTAPSPSSSPRTPQEPASKRQRMSNGSHLSTPASTPNSEAQRLEDALASEERKRVEAIEREGAGRGETKWYLSFQKPPVAQSESPLRIVSAGYSALDVVGKARSSEDDDEEAVRPQIQGRRSFGNYKSKAVKQQNPNDAESSSGSDPEDEEDRDEDEDDEDDASGAQAMIAQSRREAGEKARAERKAKRKADQADADQMAGERRKKHVKLNNHPGRISSGGGKPGGGGAARDGGGNANQSCFKCGEKGHMKRDCPR